MSAGLVPPSAIVTPDTQGIYQGQVKMNWALPAFCHGSLSATQRGEHRYCSYFTDQKNEVQLSSVSCARSPSQAAEPGRKPVSADTGVRPCHCHAVFSLSVIFLTVFPTIKRYYSKEKREKRRLLIQE